MELIGVKFVECEVVQIILIAFQGTNGSEIH